MIFIIVDPVPVSYQDENYAKFDWQPQFVDPVIAKYGGNVRRTFHYVRPHDTFNSEFIFSTKFNFK